MPQLDPKTKQIGGIVAKMAKDDTEEKAGDVARLDEQEAKKEPSDGAQAE